MFHWFDRQSRNALLERHLMQAASKVPVLAATRERALKTRVLGRIQASLAQDEVSFEELASELQGLTEHLEPSVPVQRKGRQRLLDSVLMRGEQVRVDQVLGGFWQRKRFASLAMASLVLVVGTFGYLNQMPVVSAARSSTVVSTQGFVYVERGDGLDPLEAGTLIQEGDVITTGGDGWADVVFVDDTLVTLGPSSELTVTELFVDPSNEARTSIQVVLTQGRAWTHVVNLLSNGSSFRVDSQGATFFTDHKASFDVVAAEGSVQARNFSNLLEFEIFQNGSVQEGTLGPSLALLSTPSATAVIEPVASPEELAVVDVWVQTNLYKTQDYEASLTRSYEARWQDHAGFLPGDSLYWAQRGLEEVQVWMTWDDDVRLARTQAFVNRRFSEAALLTQQGDVEGAALAWQRYQEALVALSSEMGYPEAESLLESNKKDMEVVATQEAFYDARQEVEATSLLLAPDASSKAEVQLQTAADRLGLALELVQIGAYDLALTSLEDYQTGFNDVLDQIPNLTMEERKPLILSALDQKLADLQKLKLIASELEQLPESEDALEAEWGDVYADTLYQLNSLVLNLKDRAVLHLSTFLKDVKGDETTQSEILARLKKTVPLDLEYMELINDLEALYAEHTHDVVMVDDSLVTPADGVLFLDGVTDFGLGSVGSVGLPEDQEVGGE